MCAGTAAFTMFFEQRSLGRRFQFQRRLQNQLDPGITIIGH